MPIKLRKKGEPVEPPKEEPKGPSLWDRLGRLPGALATGVRIGSSGVSNMGGPIGSAIAAGGEGLAELIEKPESFYDAIAAVPDVVRNRFSNDPTVRKATSEGFVEGAKVPISRMAVEGAIGAVPGASLIKGGKAIISAGKGGAMTGVGSLGRNYANDEPLDWEAAGVNTLLGGAIGGGIGKIIGGPSEAARKLKYQKEVQGPWKAKGLSEPPPPPVPTPNPFKGRSAEDSNKIGQIWTDDLEKGYDAEKRDLRHQLGMFDKEKTAWQSSEAKKALEAQKALQAQADEARRLEDLQIRREDLGLTDERVSFGGTISGKTPEGGRESMSTRWVNPDEEAKKAAEKLAKKTKAPPTQSFPPGSVIDDGLEAMPTDGVKVRPIPQNIPETTERRFNELLKVFGGRRGTDPAEARIGGPRKPIDPALEGEISQALPKTPSIPSIMDEVVQNTPESQLLQLLTKAQTTGEHYKGVKAAALTEPKLKEPLSILDSKGKPYTSERIAGKNARFAAQEAGLPPTNRGPQPSPSVIDPNDQTALNIERALAARKGTGMVGGGETADQVQERILREYLEAQGKANPLVSMDDPIREFKDPPTALTPDEYNKLTALGATAADIEKTPYEELKSILGKSSDVVQPGHPGMTGKLAKTPPKKKSSKPDLFAPLEGVPDDTPLPSKPNLIKTKGQQKASDLGIADDVINPLNPKGEKGGIDVGLLTKMLMGGGGALTGAALNPDDPFEGALAGGSMGLGASFAPKMLGSLGVSSKALNNIPQMIEREGIKKAANKLANELPHIQRANYLASGPGLIANAAVGPYMSGVTGAIEAMLKGDSRGWAALKLLMNPSELKGNVGSAFNEAKTLVETAERRTLGEAPTAFARAMAGPGTILTTGDVTIRNILKKAGFSEDEAKLFTMTNEPSSRIGEAAVNFQRTGGPWANMMLPFVRTPMNMLEQGAQRLPVAGGLYKLLKGGINDTLDSQALRDIAAEQAVSTATGMGAYGLGASMDQDTAKTARRFVSNAGGRNAFTSNIGFALGQESRKNNSNMGNALARSVASGFALPQTDALQDQIKMGSSILSGEAPELPSGMYPKVLDELFSSPPVTLTDVPSNVPQLRNLRLRKRGQ